MELQSIIKEIRDKIFDKKSILFSTKDEYVEFLRKLGFIMGSWHEGGLRIMQCTRFRCLEDIECFFGITFGEDTGDGNADLDNVIVKDCSNFPKEYPCLLLTCCMECMTDGNSQVNFMEEPYFIYPSDFTKKD